MAVGALCRPKPLEKALVLDGVNAMVTAMAEAAADGDTLAVELDPVGRLELRRNRYHFHPDSKHG